jgi:hypothetical protein
MNLYYGTYYVNCAFHTDPFLDVPLIEVLEPDLNGVLLALGGKYDKHDTTSMAAGLIDLLETIEMFSDIFKFEETSSSERQDYSPLLRDVIGTMLSWQLDRNDESLSRRLDNLIVAFASMLEKCHIESSEILSWSTEGTMSNWRELLVFWSTFTVRSLPFPYAPEDQSQIREIGDARIGRAEVDEEVAGPEYEV